MAKIAKITNFKPTTKITRKWLNYNSKKHMGERWNNTIRNQMNKHQLQLCTIILMMQKEDLR